MAGPLGSSLALFLGALAMIVIGANYHFMAQKYPGPGGTFSYVQAVLGPDHAFLCGWFLWLLYAAILWANATAFPLLIYHFMGPALKIGFHYTLWGYDVYLGDILCTTLGVLCLGLLCIKRVWAAVQLNTALTLFLFFSTIAFFLSVFGDLSSIEDLSPPFVPAKNASLQVFSVLALAPWAYVGYEAISHLTDAMSCSKKALFWLMTSSILAAAVVYVLLILLAATPISGQIDWRTYAETIAQATSDKPQVSLVGMPVIKVIQAHLGQAGLILLAAGIVSGVATALIGYNIILSRLTSTAARKGFLPSWFTHQNSQHIPRNALLFIMATTFVVSCMGRTAIGWIVDIATVGATLAYFYISVCAFILARREDNRLFTVTGLTGILLSLLLCAFIFMPSLWSISSLATESYFIFSAWGLLGFLYFLFIFWRDRKEQLGHTTLVWLVMLFLIFASSIMWMRQDIHESTSSIVANVKGYYSSQALKYGEQSQEAHDNRDDAFLKNEMASFSRQLIKHTLIQMFLIMVCLGVIFAVYSLMHARRRRIELEKIRAEEVSRSKSAFLSNMSHDIRTPMNAIIGFTDLALTKSDLKTIQDYLRKIKLSSNHLLSLINDVLEMSRIESGKVELQTSVVKIPEFLHNLNTIIIGQIEAKQLSLDINALNIHHENIVCDKLRLNQIFLNLMSNAIKYTPAGGRVSVNVRELEATDDEAAYEISIKDTGIGMSPEFAARIFEAFEREKTSEVHKIQGTGLGMSITKHLVDLMGGEIQLETEQGKGSEFILNFRFPIATEDPTRTDVHLEGIHVLIVDDDYSSCDAITGMLSEMGAKSEWTMSGKEAILRFGDAAKRNDPYTLCIIDWKMPDMSGVHVAQEITAMAGDKAPAIILVTAYDWLNIKDEAVKAGIKSFCNKPVFASELRTSIVSALGEKEQSEKGKAETENYDFSGIRVLLVDDIEINREIASAILTMNGVEVDLATDGTEAVEKVDSAKAGYYDVVLMDVQMPIMDGYTATQRIRELKDPEKARVPIIAMTANAFEEDRQAALNAGMNGHVPKPVDIKQLFATLKTLL